MQRRSACGRAPLTSSGRSFSRNLGPRSEATSCRGLHLGGCSLHPTQIGTATRSCRDATEPVHRQHRPPSISRLRGSLPAACAHPDHSRQSRFACLTTPLLQRSHLAVWPRLASIPPLQDESTGVAHLPRRVPPQNSHALPKPPPRGPSSQAMQLQMIAPVLVRQPVYAAQALPTTLTPLGEVTPGRQSAFHARSRSARGKASAPLHPPALAPSPRPHLTPPTMRPLPPAAQSTRRPTTKKPAAS